MNPTAETIQEKTKTPEERLLESLNEAKANPGLTDSIREAVSFAIRQVREVKAFKNQDLNPQDFARLKIALEKIKDALETSHDLPENVRQQLADARAQLEAKNDAVKKELLLAGRGQEIDLIEKAVYKNQTEALIETAGINSFIVGMLGQEAARNLGQNPSDQELGKYLTYLANTDPARLMQIGAQIEGLALLILGDETRKEGFNATQLKNLNELLGMGQKFKKATQAKTSNINYNLADPAVKAELLRFMVGNSQRGLKSQRAIENIINGFKQEKLTKEETSERLDRFINAAGDSFADNLSSGGLAQIGLLTEQAQMVTDLFGKVGEIARSALLKKILPPELQAVLGKLDQAKMEQINSQVKGIAEGQSSDLEKITQIQSIISKSFQGENDPRAYELANLFTTEGASEQAVCAVRAYLMATYLETHFPNISFTAENQIVGNTGHVRLIALIDGQYYAIDPTVTVLSLEKLDQTALPQQIKDELNKSNQEEIRQGAFARLNADMMVNFASSAKDDASKLQLLNSALQNDPDNIMAIIGLAKHYENTDIERSKIFKTKLTHILSLKVYANNNLEDLLKMEPLYKATFSPTVNLYLIDKIKTALNNNFTKIGHLVIPPTINIDASTLGVDFTYHDLISLKTTLNEALSVLINNAAASDAAAIANAITAIDTKIGSITPLERLVFAQNDFWDSVKAFINLPGNKLASDFGSEKYQHAQRLLNIAADIKSNSSTTPEQVEFYAALATILPEMHDVSLHLRTKGFDQAMAIMGKWKSKEILKVFAIPGLQEYFSLFEASLITKIAEETIYSESMLDKIKKELALIFTKKNGYDTSTNRVFTSSSPIEIPSDIYGDLATYVSDIFFRSAEAISNGKISKTTVANVTGFDIIVQIFNFEDFFIDRYNTVPPSIRPFYDKYLKPMHYVNNAINYTGFFSGWRTSSIIESLEREMPHNDNLGLSMRYFYISSNYEKYLDEIKRHRKNKGKQSKAEHEFRNKFGVPGGVNIEDFVNTKKNELLRKMITYEPDILATLFLGKIVRDTAGGPSPDAFNAIITGHVNEWRTLADKLRQARALTLDANFKGFRARLAPCGQQALVPNEQALLNNITNFLNHPNTLATLRDPKSQLKGLHKNALVNRVYYLGDFPIKVLNGAKLINDLGEDGIGRESGNLQGAKGAGEAISKTISSFTTKHHLVEQVQELFGKFGYKGADFEENYAIVPLVIQILAFEKKTLSYFPDMVTDIAHLFGVRISDAQRMQARESAALGKFEMYDELEMLLKSSGLSQETIDKLMDQFQLVFALRNIPVIGDIIFTTFLAVIASLISSLGKSS